jgi:hypothetical protein
MTDINDYIGRVMSWKEVAELFPEKWVVFNITKFLMKVNNLTHDTAYAHLMGMELYKLLMKMVRGGYRFW